MSAAQFVSAWGCAPADGDVVAADEVEWFVGLDDDPDDDPDSGFDSLGEPLVTAWSDQSQGGSRRRAGLYDELRFWAGRRARIDLRVAELVAELVADQVDEDLAQQAAFGVDRVGLAPLPESEVRQRARVAVIDSAVATVGGPRRAWLQSADLGQASAQVCGPLREAVDAGALSFEQACAVVQDTAEVGLSTEESAQVVEAVCSHATRTSASCGSPIGQQTFRRRLRAEVVKRTDRPRRMARAAATRRVWSTVEADGMGSFEIRGNDARCAGAFSRVDAIARAVRSGGDARTLEQLRADVALDLLIFGRPEADAPTSVDAPGDSGAGWPTAHVDVVISAASLLGVTDEPGRVGDLSVAASTVRRIAHAQGGVWRRIVTDPVTGYAMDAVVESYRPPAAMARAVRARDGQCRAPGCARPAAQVDLDHVHERRDIGPTCGDNLQALCVLHHAKKTRRHWRATIAPGGVVTWTLPGGQVLKTYPLDYRDLDPSLGDGAHVESARSLGAGPAGSLGADPGGSRAAESGGSRGADPARSREVDPGGSRGADPAGSRDAGWARSRDAESAASGGADPAESHCPGSADTDASDMCVADGVATSDADGEAGRPVFDETSSALIDSVTGEVLGQIDATTGLPDWAHEGDIFRDCVASWVFGRRRRPGATLTPKERIIAGLDPWPVHVDDDDLRARNAIITRRAQAFFRLEREHRELLDENASLRARLAAGPESASEPTYPEPPF